MKFGQLQKKISKASLPVSADLSNDFKSVILETDQRKINLMKGKFWRSSKIIWNLLSVMLHITPWLLMLMLHIRQSNYLVLTNVLSTSFLNVPHYIRWTLSAQHCLYNSGKGRCTRYMWSNDMFVLWNRISAIFYEDRKYCLHIFPKQHALVH